MSLRRVVIAASTMFVAVLLALGVPFAQLQTVSDRATCCCPDPSKCKCPDHEPDHQDAPTMKACHKQAPKSVTAQLAAFVPPELPVTIAPRIAAEPVAHVIATPHPAPAPRRPDAPS